MINSSKANRFSVLALVLIFNIKFTFTQENFCDIACVQKIYDFYCGRATCTTGAVDYVQIYAMCDDTCTSAILGELMLECLENGDPNRDDWSEVQEDTIKEIHDFCQRYGFDLNVDVEPLPKSETDKELIKTLYDDEPVSEKLKITIDTDVANDRDVEDENDDIAIDYLYEFETGDFALESVIAV